MNECKCVSTAPLCHICSLACNQHVSQYNIGQLGINWLLILEKKTKQILLTKLSSALRKEQVHTIYLAYRHFEGSLPSMFLHLSALMNRLALSDLLMKSCSKFQSEISNHLDNVLSVSWHHLFGILCRPL